MHCSLTRLSSCCNDYQSSSWISLRPNLKIKVLHERGEHKLSRQNAILGKLGNLYSLAQCEAK